MQTFKSIEIRIKNDFPPRIAYSFVNIVLHLFHKVCSWRRDI